MYNIETLFNILFPYKLMIWEKSGKNMEKSEVTSKVGNHFLSN
jgi:hypothetical protein